MRCRLNRMIACKPLTQFFYLFIYFLIFFQWLASPAGGELRVLIVSHLEVFSQFLYTPLSRLGCWRNVVEQKPELTQLVFKYVMWVTLIRRRRVKLRTFARLLHSSYILILIVLSTLAILDYRSAFSGLLKGKRLEVVKLGCYILKYFWKMQK